MNTANGANIEEPPRSRRPSHEGSRNSSGRRERAWSRRSKLLLGLVVLLALVTFFTGLLLGTRLYALDRQNRMLRSELSEAQETLRQFVPEVQQLRQDLDDLVRGKLPRLRELEYDRVLPLDQGYLKNIAFTEVRTRSARSYEYKLVVQNSTRSTLWPEIRIDLFNEYGIQIGGAAIGTQAPTALRASSLDVGEVRSYAGSLDLADPDEAPQYFLVRIPKSDLMQDDGFSAPEGSETDAEVSR